MIGVTNPIEGTVLDPKRKAWLRMEDAGMGPGGSEEGGGEGTGGDMEGGSPVNANTLPPNGAPTPTPAADAPSGSQWNENMPNGRPAMMAGIDRPSALDSGPTSTDSGQASADGAEDAFYQKMLNTGMDDTPSQARITELEGQLHRAPMSMKQKIVRALMMAAPIALGGALGGSAGVEGAAGGVMDAEETMQKRQHDHDATLRTQIESERGRQERQYERRMQIPVQYENMRMRRELQKENTLYKNGMLTVAQQKANTGTANAGTAADKANLAWYVKGLDPKTRQPLSDDQLPPGLKAQVLGARSQVELRTAQEELARARAAGIPQQIEIARQRLEKAATAQSLALRTFIRDTYGTDLDGNPLPGAPLIDDGNGGETPVGLKMAPNVRPSMQSRSRADQGDAVMTAGDDLTTYIKAHRGDVGDVGAIVNSAFLGTPLADPKSAKMASMLASYAALQPALHGFRGQDALREFAKIIGGLPKDADALIAAIEGIRGTAGIVSKVGKMKVATGAAGKLKRPGDAAPGGSGNVVKWGTDKNGNPVRVGQ